VLERLRAERDRPREGHVVLRCAEAHARRDEHGPCLSRARGGGFRDACAEEGVGVEGQVRSVLLDRAGRDDDDGPLAVERADLLVGEELQARLYVNPSRARCRGQCS
jgi:hypothetical protein